MYFIKVENEENYDKIIVDSKCFYKLKSPTIQSKKKKRYSDTLKDPLYIEQDIFRKLNMIKQFREKNGDIYELIEKYKNIIEECIIIMDKEYDIKPSEIFKLFNLEKYGFKLDDFER
ncbi:hypothetical protein NAPIS_ORF00189 [Vairimorpha apis BRL 01]|uniref:Uncharacterized protein n=1 Tax=Vairimorpha apis BRL 01 TaxID=1037528 RepID=T0L411_9MICR|nr:hypothetical protein NAPIS_ORF00189 [Vairimorpha apis BRL 01]